MSSAAPASAAPPPKPFQTKLVLLGEAAVGKSSFVLRYIHGEFEENRQPTIGAAFLTNKCRLEDKVIKFEIWDTAGQERFHSLAPMYYRNAQASVVIYDVTKASSFEKAKSWVKELQRQANPNIIIALVGNKVDLLQSAATAAAAGSEDGDGNCVDDDDDDDSKTATNDESAATAKATATATSTLTATGASLRAVSKEEAKAYANEAGLLFYETSAKTGEGVANVFTEIAKKLNPQDIQPQGQQGQFRSRVAGATNSASSQSGNISLGEGQQRRQEACNC